MFGGGPFRLCLFAKSIPPLLLSSDISRISSFCGECQPKVKSVIIIENLFDQTCRMNGKEDAYGKFRQAAHKTDT